MQRKRSVFQTTDATGEYSISYFCGMASAGAQKARRTAAGPWRVEKARLRRPFPTDALRNGCARGRKRPPARRRREGVPCGLLPAKAAKRPGGAPEGSASPAGCWAEGPKRPTGMSHCKGCARQRTERRYLRTSETSGGRGWRPPRRLRLRTLQTAPKGFVGGEARRTAAGRGKVLIWRIRCCGSRG